MKKLSLLEELKQSTIGEDMKDAFKNRLKETYLYASRQADLDYPTHIVDEFEFELIEEFGIPKW